MWVTANKGVKIHINSDILTSSLPPAKGPRTRLEEFFVIALSNDQWGKKSKVTAAIVLMQQLWHDQLPLSTAMLHLQQQDQWK